MSKKFNIKNSFWYSSERLLRIISNFLVAIFLARYLGPESFGIYTLVIGIMMIFVVIAKFGMETPLIRELTNSHDSNISGAFWAGVNISIIVVMILTLAVIVFVTSFPSTYDKFIFLALAATIATPLISAENYYHAQMKSKKVMKIRNSLVFSTSIIKVFLCVLDFGLYYIIFVSSLEIVLASIFIGVFYSRDSKTPKMNYEFSNLENKKILKSSFPIFVSALMIVLYTKVDQIMIAVIADEKSLGIYSVAIKIFDSWLSLIVAFTVSLIPFLTKIKDTKDYEIYFKTIMTCLIWLSFLLFIFFIIFGKNLLNYIFGSEYIAAYIPTTILLFSSIFAVMGSMSTRHFTIGHNENLIFYRVLLALISNVFLNFLLIPSHGILGASVATLFALIVANFLVDILDNMSLFKMKLVCIKNPWQSFNWRILID